MSIAVTGAFGYSGKYIAQRLLAAGHEVVTLTRSTQRQNSFGGRLKVAPMDFDKPEQLADSLRGVEALINTYWVRFDHKLFTHTGAVENTRRLFAAAKAAGVRRIVHISITNPDAQSDLPYFRGKAELEKDLKASGLSYCILRPAVLFGKEDVLINNIAWSLRHLPMFGMFGDGTYKMQPIYVDDLAAACVEKATQTRNETIEAIGPETFVYKDMVRMIAKKLGLHRIIVNVPPAFGYIATRMLGAVLRDVIITREEIRGLMENRLYVDAPPLGRTKLSEWVELNKATLGRSYTSELARRLDRASSYKSN